MNLLQSTLDLMAREKLKPKDIIFVGNNNQPQYSGSWAVFALLADGDDFERFTGPQVARDLIIEFRDGRRFYRAIDDSNGDERWQVHRPLTIHDDARYLRKVYTTEQFDTIPELNQ